MNKENIKYIVIHCSATRSNMTYTPWQLDRDHRARGFRCAGYHFYISRDGNIESFRGLNERGAHVRGFNDCSIGICYEGGLDTSSEPADTRTKEQKTALLGLLRYLRSYFPNALIVGHRDLSPDRNGDGKITSDEWLKACPCFDAIKAYRSL